ncbi:MAG: hypothetical protein Q8J76_11875, partial [Desulfobulbaceae bacterium]|nr:hypothetical protein [Desulfobulbaceae bacterium]
MLSAKIYKSIEQRHTRKISTFLSGSQFLVPERVRGYQFEKIKIIIAHAYAQVPYYRRLFADIGITPEDIRTREDFVKIPVLTKEIIRSNSKDLIA